MGIVAGIDEAGYGPLLGPLLVAGAVFETPDDCGEDVDLWKALADCVSSRVLKDKSKIVVTDSKKVYSAAKGLGRLEETALSFMFCKNEVKGFKELLAGFAGGENGVLDVYPWYCGQDIELPVAAEVGDIIRHSENLTNSLKNSGINLLNISAVPVATKEFNDEAAKTGNKSVLLFNKCAGLLVDIWNRHGTASPKVYIDKHGARNRYMHLLAPVFKDGFIRIHEEGDLESVYEIIGDDRSMFVSFIQGSETKHLPIALASICCKYIRELFMRLFNQYWLGQMPDLKPTAGYYTDAMRFLNDIEEKRASLGIEKGLMVRAK